MSLTKRWEDAQGSALTRIVKVGRPARSYGNIRFFAVFPLIVRRSERSMQSVRKQRKLTENFSFEKFRNVDRLALLLQKFRSAAIMVICSRVYKKTFSPFRDAREGILYRICIYGVTVCGA